MAERAELTIVLKADGSGLTGTVRVSADEVRKLGVALDETADKADKTTAANRRAGESSGVMGKAVGAAAAAGVAAAAGFVVMAAQAINVADQCYLASQRLGVTTEWLSTMQSTARDAGVETQQLDSALNSFTNTAAKAAGGSKEQAALFAQLGIEARDASTGGLKNLDQLLPEVAKKLAGYKDGAGKAAIANQLFGEGGAKLIPLLNQLGAEGFDALAARAASLGQVIDTETATAANRLKSDIDTLAQVTRGYAMDVAKDVLPSLSSLAKVLADQAVKSRESGDETTVLGTIIKTAVSFFISFGAGVERSVVILANFIDRVKLSWQSVKDTFGNAEYWQGMVELASGNINLMAVGFERIRGVSAKVTADYAAGTSGLMGAMDQTLADIDQRTEQRLAALEKTTTKTTAALTDTGKAADLVTPPVIKLGNAVDKSGQLAAKAEREWRAHQKALQDQRDAMDDLAAITDEYSGASEPMRAAIAGNRRELEQLDKVVAVLLAQGAPTVDMQQRIAVAYGLVTTAADERIRAAEREQDVLGNLRRGYEEDIRLAGMSAEQRQVEQTVLAAMADARAMYGEAYAAQHEQEIRQLAEKGEAMLRLTEQANAASQAIGDAMGDAVVDVIVDFDNLGDAADSVFDAMADQAKRAVSEILSQFFRLQVINPLLNSLLGTSLQTGGAGSFDLSSILSMFGGGTSGSGGGVGSMFSSNSWVQWGQNLWSGFAGAGANAGSALVANSPLLYTAPTQGFTGAGSLGWDGFSGAGFGGDFGGGTAAYGSNAGATGTAAAGASTAAIAAGAIAVAVIVNGMFEKQGWHIENGFDNGAVNRLALSGMPIVDVSALAQYGVRFADGFLQKLGLDKTWASMLSGSSITARLFGNQDPKIQRQGYEFEFGGDVASGNAYADWKAKGGLFSSSQWGTQEQALSAEMADQIQTFWDSVRAAMVDTAATLGTDVPAMISASFKSTYDKDNKLISEVGTILGRTYNESFEVFQQRILAENIIATVGVSTPQTETITGYTTSPRHRDRDTGQWVEAVTTPIIEVISEASAIAERWRGSAEELLAGAQFLMAAQQQMNDGNGLLGDDATLTQVTDFVESLQTANESLIDTYVRLAGGAALMDQALGLAGLSVDMTREELVRYSAALVDQLGGLDQAASYLGDFWKRYYSEGERAEYTLAETTSAASTQFAAAGLNLDDFVGENGNAKMRAMVEDALASGNAELAAQYLKLAAALGLVNDAQAAYNATIGEAAGPVAQTAEQLATVNEILDANDWTLAAAGMNQAQLSIRNINRQFDDYNTQLLANAATVEQLTRLEAQRDAALRAQYDAFVAQFAPQADQSTLAGQTDTIRAWEAQQIELAETYAAAAGMEGVAAEDLANIHDEAARRIAAAQATFQQAYDDFAASFEAPDIAPRSVAEAAEQTAAWEQAQIERLEALALAAGMQGAAEEDLALIRARALDALALATAQFEQTYQDFVAQFRPDAALPTGADAGTLAEAQSQADAWAQSMIDQATAYAIAAGREGIAAEDLANIHAMAASAVEAAAERMAAALVDYNDFIENIRRESGQYTQYQMDMQDANRWYTDAVAEANRLARAAGLVGAAEEDLDVIRQRSVQLLEEAYRRLVQTGRDLVAQLQGSATGSLGDIESQISQLEAATASFGSTAGEAAESMLRSMQTVRDYLDSMLLGDLSALSPEDQLAEAWRQLQEAAAAGNGEQATQLADVYLRLLRESEASGGDYNAGWQAVRDLLQGMLQAPLPGDVGGGGTVGPSPALIALYEERDRLLAEQEAAHRLEMGQQLAVIMRDMMAATGQSLLQVAEELGLDLADFIDAMGINLDSLTVQTVQQLAGLASTLGISVTELAGAVGFALGDLADRQSLLNLAVQSTIDGLPTESADALQPYLDAIADATTEADANEALRALIAQINLQPDDIRSQLAPYFEGILPAQSLGQLDYLSTIADDQRTAVDLARDQIDVMGQMLSAADDANNWLQRIADNASANNSASGIPAFAAGGWVNGPTTLLAGEAGPELILPSPVSAFLSRVGIPVNTGGGGGVDPSLVAEVRALRAELVAIRRGQSDIGGAVVGAINDTADRSDDRRREETRELAVAIEGAARGNL